MKELKSALLFLSFLGLFFSSCSTTAPLTMTQIDKKAQRHAAEKHNKGLVIGYIAEGQQYVKGFGIKSNEDLSSPDGKSVFEIGAVTEVFTAMLMHRLSDEGKFDPADCVNDYLKDGMKVPDFYPLRCTDVRIEPQVSDETRFLYPTRVTSCTADISDAKCVSFCNLSSHTSGMRFSGFDSYRWHLTGLLSDWDAQSDMKSSRFMRKINLRSDIATMPGRYFHYSSAGQAVLGNTLSVVAERPFSDLLDEYILKPLLLEKTKLISTDELLQGHTKNGRATAPAEFDAYAPAGGLVSTADDLLKFLQLQINPTEKFESAVERTHDVRAHTFFQKSGKSVSVTNGWFVSPIDSDKKEVFYWKNGGTKGFNAFIAFEKKKRTGVVVLANSAESVDEIGWQLMQILQNESLNLTVAAEK